MIHMQQEFSAQDLRRVFGFFASGVVAVCARVNNVPVGMAASSFTSVSVDPALVSVCIQRTSSTWPLLRDRPRLGISILAEGHEHACRQLASKDGDRFAGVEWDASLEDSVFIRGSGAWLEVSLYDELPAGDHVIALLEVHGFDTAEENLPLIFNGSHFHKLHTPRRLVEDEQLAGRC